jgi:putative polyhydroxyalkanoate system protein
MPDIRIHREHALGLDKARAIADAWADDVQREFDMACDVTRGKTSDTVSFKRTGVSGTLTVAADHFDLHAKLGILLGVFAKTIEEHILKNLDAQLAQASAAPAAKTAAKTSAKVAVKAPAKAPAKTATPKKG